MGSAFGMEAGAHLVARTTIPNGTTLRFKRSKSPASSHSLSSRGTNLTKFTILDTPSPHTDDADSDSDSTDVSVHGDGDPRLASEGLICVHVSAYLGPPILSVDVRYDIAARDPRPI